ncbi:MAG: NAD-dependent epimerase/dehydratase family protein [Pseudomonadota bacterium]
MHTSKDVVQADSDYALEALKTEMESLGGHSVLITGGAGFLGYYFVLFMLAHNDRSEAAQRIHVTVYDNFMRGVPEWLSHLKERGDIDIVKHDIIDPLPVDLRPVDYIIHAASIASPTFYRQHPLATMDANVDGLRRLLENSRERAQSGNPISGFLFFSSSEIYGDPTPDNIPTDESYRGNVACIGPRACYDESKRYGETLCSTFANMYDLPITMARPFNNYGPGLKITDRRALPDFARDVLADRDISLLSDGGPTRTFCYVADAVVGYLKVLVRGAPGEPYNIGNPEPEITIRELAECVASTARDLFGYSGEIVFAKSDDSQYLVDNPLRRCPSIKKAREALDYEPRIGLEDGIRRSLIWYSENREGDSL